ncbi:MAG: glycerophosphodiester phosphodiesterase family protein [Pyrinomonadaceae bacterium]
MTEPDFPLIIGHRGACAVAPENTLISFARAFDDGADGIEFDVRLARDHVLVCLHDATLQRTALTSGAVGEFTSAELAEADVGTWFNRKFSSHAREAYAAARIPTLEQALALADRRGAKAIYLELKCDARQAGAHARAAAEILRADYAMAQIVVIESFTLEAIAAVKRIAPWLRTAALFERTASRLLARATDLITSALEHGADELALPKTLINAHLLEAAAAARLPIVVWTIDDPRWLNRARKLGLKAIITNDPRSMRGLPT